MVRLVFRPYTQIWRSICTSESLRASTRVSPGFTLFRHSSPSFGYQHICSYSNLSDKSSRSVDNAKLTIINYHKLFLPQIAQCHPSLSLRARVYHPNTCIHVRLLGPCFKTGRITPFCQRSRTALVANKKVHSHTSQTQQAVQTMQKRRSHQY